MVKLKDLVCITLIGMAYQYMLSSCSCSDNTSLSILPLPESVEVKHGTFCCDESRLFLSQILHLKRLQDTCQT